MTPRPARPKLDPSKPCMAIATAQDLCGKPTSVANTVLCLIGKSFVVVNLCAKHKRKPDSTEKAGRR